MALPRPGVFVVVSCSGTLEQGFPFHIRIHSNYFVVVVFWIFVACKIYTCPVIGVRCCKAWVIHPVLKKHEFFSFFQILVLSYELFTSLPFFSHYPDNPETHQAHEVRTGKTIVFHVQWLLDLFTARVRPLWTLLGMLHLRKRGMGILNIRQGEVCMVAPPLLNVHFFISFH